jgi:hypothetical protein
MGKHLAWWPMEGIQCLEVNGEAYCLVANGRFQAWWPLERKGKTFFSPIFIFLFDKVFFFPLILRFYFTMVLNHYFTFFLSFP